MEEPITDLAENADKFRGQPLRSFGRMRGRALTEGAAQNLIDMTRRFGLVWPEGGQIDLNGLMAARAGTHFEIGFGGGEHIAQSAARWPDILHMGAEPFEDGASKLARQIGELALENVRFLAADGRPALDALPDNCLDRLIILFPDPWHKARHNKRRLIQPALLANAHRILKKGGELRFATDWADYAAYTRDHVAAFSAAVSNGFSGPLGKEEEWIIPPEDHITTRYEEKKLGDCAPIFLRFLKI